MYVLLLWSTFNPIADPCSSMWDNLSSFIRVTWPKYNSEFPKLQQYLSLYEVPLLCPHFFCNLVLMIHKSFSIPTSQKHVASACLCFLLSTSLNYKKTIAYTMDLYNNTLVALLISCFHSNVLFRLLTLRLYQFYEQCLHCIWCHERRFHQDIENTGTVTVPVTCPWGWVVNTLGRHVQ